MRIEGRAVPARVLDCQNEPHGALMERGDRLTLSIGSSILFLKVDNSTLDLDAHDLIGSEERQIDRCPLLPDRQFDRWLHRGMHSRHEHPDESELARVAQAWLTPRVDAQDQVETDRFGLSSERCDAHVRIANLQPYRGRPRDARSVSCRLNAQAMDRAGQLELSADSSALVLCTTTTRT